MNQLRLAESLNSFTLGSLNTVGSRPVEEKSAVNSSPVKVIPGIPYRKDADDAYVQQQCHIDLYSPSNQDGPLPLLVWLHGGGLVGGARDDLDTKALCASWAAEGMVVASVGYRFSPLVLAPAHLQDAAQAVAWLVLHAEEHGVDFRNIFVGGHSAGGYLAAMLAADPRWLTEAGVPVTAIAGVIPVSATVFTHAQVRKEQGVPHSDSTPKIDPMAPCWYVNNAAQMPPILLLCGDQDEFAGRLEENRYFATMLRANGNRTAEFHTIRNRNHVGIVQKMPFPDDPARELILGFLKIDRSQTKP